MIYRSELSSWEVRLLSLIIRMLFLLKRIIVRRGCVGIRLKSRRGIIIDPLELSFVNRLGHRRAIIRGRRRIAIRRERSFKILSTISSSFLVRSNWIISSIFLVRSSRRGGRVMADGNGV